MSVQKRITTNAAGRIPKEHKMQINKIKNKLRIVNERCNMHVKTRKDIIMLNNIQIADLKLFKNSFDICDSS